MNISKIHIQNFRSFENAEFKVSERSAVVGENNSGKSSILRALNAFFNLDDEKIYFEQGDHQYTSNRHVQIELLFGDIPDKGIYNQNLNRDSVLQIKLSYARSSKRFRYMVKAGTSYQDAPSLLLEELRKDLKFVYIPANRNHRDTIATEQSLLNSLLEIYIDEYLSQRDTVTPKIKTILRQLENNALKKLAKEIDKNYLLSHDFEIKLSHVNEPDYKILLENIHLIISEKGNDFKLYQCGSGIQSIIIIALYRFIAKLQHQNIIIGIEEPEINLHPHSQKELVNFIKSNRDELQVIFTTHSTVVVDQLEHNEIILVKKVTSDSRNFKSEVYAIPDDFWTLYNIEEYKYYQFYKYRNSDFFFSKYVIVCESKNDAEILNYLFTTIDIDIDTKGISILNLEGIKFLKYPYYLLQHLKIPYLLVLDKDFFLPYQNDETERSRYSSGFFNYRREFKNDNFIEELIDDVDDRDQLVDLLVGNHSRALDILEKYNVICFKYNLEMDLVNSKRAKQEFYRVLNIPAQHQNSRTILKDRRKVIKRLGVLMRVVRNVPHANLPNSYKRIKKIVKQKATEFL